MSSVPAELNPTLRTIFERKSVRHFREGTIPEEQLLLLIRAGMAAPSAKDCRPWHFILVRERERLDSLARQLPFARMALQAAAAIVVVGDPQLQAAGPEFDYWALDGSAATQNILLAAEALGLGAVWTAVHPRSERVAVVRRELAIPERYIPLNFIPIGLPEGRDLPRDKYDPGRIHLERWRPELEQTIQQARTE